MESSCKCSAQYTRQHIKYVNIVYWLLSHYESNRDYTKNQTLTIYMMSKVKVYHYPVPHKKTTVNNLMHEPLILF